MSRNTSLRVAAAVSGLLMDILMVIDETRAANTSRNSTADGVGSEWLANSV